MIALGLDFETTGKDPQTARITEVGAVLKDCLTGEVLVSLSQLVYDKDYPSLSQEVVDVTGITDDMLKEKGIPLMDALDALHGLMDLADCVMAHNAQYDRTVYETEMHRKGLEPRLKVWVCTLTEVPYAEKYGCKRLSHLALDHGIVVDPSKLHRAVGDVELMFELLEKGGYTMEMIMDYRAIPSVIVRAKVSYDDREKAKARRYSWEKVDNLMFPKQWVKKMKSNKVDQERAEAGFEISIVGKVD